MVEVTGRSEGRTRFGCYIEDMIAGLGELLGAIE